MKLRTGRPQLLRHGEVAGYSGFELEEDAFVSELDEAALVEHYPAVRIVRVYLSGWCGRRDEVVMRVVHHRPGPEPMAPWGGDGEAGGSWGDEEGGGEYRQRRIGDWRGGTTRRMCAVER